MIPKAPTVRRLRLRNYRSVRDETIEFANPLFLVGRNGSGKSNVVDALAFLSDCMTLGFPAAVNSRPGIAFIHLSGEEFQPVYMDIELEFGSYSLMFHYERGLGFVIDEENCLCGKHFYRRTADKVEASVTGFSRRVPLDRLALPLVAAFEEFTRLADELALLRVYHISHQAIRQADNNGVPESSRLSHDGANIGGVLRFDRSADAFAQETNRWLKTIVPKTHVELSTFGDSTRLYFLQEVNGINEQRGLLTNMVSDGTLDALGVIGALLQRDLSLVVIEEPEANLHPGAVAVIAELIQEASERMQVVITTHSPELLDQKWIGADNLRIVTWEDGETRVSELGPVPKASLQDHLRPWYAGRLLRANLLEPAPR